jgi:predicted PurR-regulated permease PerM
MFGLDRRALMVAWTLFAFALALAAVYAMRRTIVIFVLALFLGHLLAPIVEFAESFFPKRTSRTLALAIVYVVLLGALVSITIPLGSRIGEQAALLAGKLPKAMQEQDPLKNLPLPTWLEPARDRLTVVLQERVRDLDQEVLPILSKAGAQILTGLGNLLSVVLIPILSFLFLKDGAAMRDTLVDSFDPAHHDVVRDIFADLHLLLAQYIRALVLLSLATLTFYFGFLTIAGVPYAILLAGIAAILEFIPVVGPLSGFVVVLLVATFSGYTHLLWIVVFLVVYRIFQDYVLNPYLMSAGVEIHPLLVLFGVLAGEEIAGVPGMFFSVPLIAALRVILVRLSKRQVYAT